MPSTVSARPIFSHDAERPLGLWLLCVVILNILLCSANAYGGDIGYWINWISQLEKRGFTNLEANYPPFYMLWLWLTARFYAFWQLVPENGLLLRWLVNTPVLLAHASLLLLADRCLQRAAAGGRDWNLCISFIALNPAILMNGPMWGQVDMLYSLLIALAFYALAEARYLLLVAPLLTVAVLTKFQAICIAPAILPLLWQHRRNTRLWAGLVPAAVLAGLLLLPYIMSNSLLSMIKQTYIQATTIYPYATYNGNNLWQLLGLNTRPDNIFLFDWGASAEGWRRIFTPKLAGIILFSIWSLWITISGFRARTPSIHWRNAILSALGFFALLPGMHERYLFPAVILALVAAARFVCFRPAAIWLSALSFANMCFVLHPTGGALPSLFAALTLAFALKLACSASGLIIPWRQWTARLPLAAWSIAALLLWAGTLGWELKQHLPDQSGWLDATRIKERSSNQSWGDLHVDESVEGRTLAVNGQRYAKGFGTHAASTISIRVPPAAAEFSVGAGIDDESRGGEVAFSIALDGKTVWQSGRLVSGSPVQTANIDVRSARTITLAVDPLGSNANDHANWLEPRFRIAPQAGQE